MDGILIGQAIDQSLAGIQDLLEVVQNIKDAFDHGGGQNQIPSLRFTDMHLPRKNDLGSSSSSRVCGQVVVLLTGEQNNKKLAKLMFLLLWTSKANTELSVDRSLVVDGRGLLLLLLSSSLTLSLLLSLLLLLLVVVGPVAVTIVDT